MPARCRRLLTLDVSATNVDWADDTEASAYYYAGLPDRHRDGVVISDLGKSR